MVLALRMAENLLPKGKIWEDVTTMDASNSTAVGAGGGFPCQAGFVCQMLFYVFLHIVQTSIVCEGVSCGGAQRGLLDSCSALVRWIFHVFDSLPTKQQPCSQYSVFSTLLLVQ